MAYNFYVDGVMLPITPSKVTVKHVNRNSVISLINNGEVNVLKDPGLTEISFDVCLPNVKYPFAVYPDGFKPAEFYLKMFEGFKVGKKPFRFICSRVSPGGNLLFDTNFLVSLEDFSSCESTENGTDIVASVRLKQYKTYGTKKYKIETSAVTVQRPADPPKPATYTVVKGDCLWNIAKKLLGNGSRYVEIYQLNKDKISNPNLIYAGQVLTMPG